MHEPKIRSSSYQQKKHTRVLKYQTKTTKFVNPVAIINYEHTLPNSYRAQRPVVLALEVLSECEFSVITGQKMKSKSLTPINIQGHSPTTHL